MMIEEEFELKLYNIFCFIKDFSIRFIIVFIIASFISVIL